MISSQEISAYIPDFIKVFHGVCLLFFGVRLVFACLAVFKLQSSPDSYSARLFTFAYFSLAAWIFWVFQYVLTLPFLIPPRFAFLTTALWLGIVQNALWTCAALSFSFKPHSFKPFPLKSLTFPLLVVVAGIFAVVAYRTGILNSPTFNDYVTSVDGIWNFASFTILGISLFQLGYSKRFAEAFLIHGFTQWIWRLLLISPWAATLAVQLAFPTWRIFLFIMWTRLISEMAKTTETADQKIAQVSNQAPGGTQRQTSSNLLVTLKVMISSTVEDLGPEREAADRAITGLKLTRFRAETLGSFPHSPEVICALMAEQCDVFILIIGERYGYEIKSRKISVVEFEYDIARKQNRGKILVYIKEGVTREPRLADFVKRLEDFESGHFRTLFKTPEELTAKIQSDVARWIVSRMQAAGASITDSQII